MSSPAGRAQVIADLAACIRSVAVPHAVRVAVDGITGAGKTTLAGELTGELRRRGEEAVHLTMDGFHHPRSVRYRQGRLSADGYYEDAYDFPAFVDEVLRPLGPGGDGSYRPRIIDLPTDEPLDEPPRPLPAEAFLVVDGSFLQRAQTAGHWDFVVFVDVPFEEARRRGTTRDADLLGGLEAAERAYDVRYHAAARRYVDEVDPAARADVRFVNAPDPAHPVLVPRPPS